MSVFFDSKYKTELCRNFTETGQCPRGDDCLFAHGKSDLRGKQSPKYKKELCRNFMEKGYCQYENRCSFAHGLYELKASSRSSGLSYKEEGCFDFHINGVCYHGTRCFFSHERLPDLPVFQKTSLESLQKKEKSQADFKVSVLGKSLLTMHENNFPRLTGESKYIFDGLCSDQRLKNLAPSSRVLEMKNS